MKLVRIFKRRPTKNRRIPFQIRTKFPTKYKRIRRTRRGRPRRLHPAPLRAAPPPPPGGPLHAAPPRGLLSPLLRAYARRGSHPSSSSSSASKPPLRPRRRRHPLPPPLPPPPRAQWSPKRWRGRFSSSSRPGTEESARPRRRVPTVPGWID
jgi:hypothetical protein